MYSSRIEQTLVYGARAAACQQYTREQLDPVKGMIRQIANQTMGGMQNVAKPGDKALLKINTKPAASWRRGGPAGSSVATSFQFRGRSARPTSTSDCPR